MKCSYCGIKWKTLPGASGLNHDDNDCPMAGVYTYPPVIESVNKAIESAIINTQADFINGEPPNMPEDCQHFKNCSQCIQVLISEKEPAARVCCCPCSQWKREKKP